MRNGRGVGIVQSRWLVALAALLLVASDRASAADRGRSAAHRASHVTPSAEVLPIVVTDPGTGATVKIWSRSDGFTAKIAWARLNGSGWGHAHDLTFGLGTDRDPAVGITSSGSWLFWRNEIGQVLYAPLELSAGRLLGVPSPLPMSMGGVTVGGVGGIRPGSLPGIEGGVDSPVILFNCDPGSGDVRCVQPKNPPTGGGPGTTPPILEGGTDAPVTTGGVGGIGVTLVVSSQPTCDRQIVTFGATDSLTVLEVDGAGRLVSRKTASLEPGVTAEAAGQYFLLASCSP